MTDPKWRKLALSMGLGAVVGFAATMLLFEVGDPGIIGEISNSEIAAVGAGAFYLVMALFVGIGTLSPQAGSKFLNVEDEEELREQRMVLLLSSIALAFWGVVPIALAISGEGGLLAREIGLAVAVIGLGVGSIAVWRSYRHSDEFTMLINQEAGSLAYLLVLITLGGWGVLAHLGYTPGPQPLDLMTAFYVLVMIATFVAAGRRGMLDPK